MSPKNAKKNESGIEVMDREPCVDVYQVELERKELIERLAEEGGAHVYIDGDHMVISPRPLGPRLVIRAIRKSEMERAREYLKEGDAPGEVWKSLRISAANISRIAKQEGISLPTRWFPQVWEETHPDKKFGCCICSAEGVESHSQHLAVTGLVQ